jgi:MoaA/NifB/PqqE/SkfB family radical SAM enzyme
MNQNNITRVEFHISYKCLNNCVFCSERDQIKKFKDQFVSKNEIEKKLIEFSKKGVKHVTFTGGEPSLHPYFREILCFAKKLNYTTYVSSNGGLFYSTNFCKKTFPYIDEICFSIHGHNPTLHNLHTKNPQSFNRLIEALNNLEKFSTHIFGFANIVITKYNFNFLEEIIEFIQNYEKIKQILISNIAPEGNGLHNFEKLVVPLSLIRKKIKSIMESKLRKTLIIRFFGVPLCIFEEWKFLSNDLHWAPRITVEKWKIQKKVYLKTTFSYKPTRKRIKTEKCKKCQAKEICGGIFKQYYQIFGDGELKPIYLS